MNITKDRSVILGEYFIENKGTVRALAKIFGLSKSTVHKDLTKKLPEIDSDLANNVRELLAKNISTRHIRGGEATKLKYKNNHKKNLYLVMGGVRDNQKSI